MLHRYCTRSSVHRLYNIASSALGQHGMMLSYAIKMLLKQIEKSVFEHWNLAGRLSHGVNLVTQYSLPCPFLQITLYFQSCTYTCWMGVWIRWNGLDWTGMEWNGRMQFCNSFVGVTKLTLTCIRASLATNVLVQWKHDMDIKQTLIWKQVC